MKTISVALTTYNGAPYVREQLDSIARQVGYGSAFALSAAFKRERGLSPREYRRAQAPATDAAVGH